MMKSIDALYIHFPFCQHLCNYCDFYKHELKDVQQISNFEEKLQGQVEYLTKFLKKHGQELGILNSLYIGGGTPSLWGKKGILFFQKWIEDKIIQLTSDCEFTIEVDPDSWTEEEIEGWLNVGVNRFSIGSQAFTDRLIKTMDRTHCLADVEKTLKYFSERKLNFSVDLMLGLPHSEKREIRTELEKILEYNPPHLSLYILKTRSNYPLNSFLPEDETIRGEYLQVSQFLEDRGYEHYEVSNFARDKHFSKHNLKYWHYDNVAALGPNATGLVVEEDKSTRYQWKSTSIGMIKEVIEGESLAIEKLFLGLRSHLDFSLDQLFDISQKPKLDAIYNCWDKNNYLAKSSSRENIQLNALGYLMCDSLIDDIFKSIDFT